MSDWRETISADVTSVEVEIPHGSVEIRAAPSGEPGYVAAESPCEVESTGGRLQITRRSGWPSDLEIALPASVRRLQLQTGHGDVSVEGVDADLEIGTGKGDIQAGDGGRGEFSTGKGDIHIGAWRGRLQLSTGKGNVEVDSAPEGIEATTGKGDVQVGSAGGRVEVNTGKGNLVFGRLSGQAELQTGKGDVVVTDLADARLEVQTSKGNVALDGRVAGLRVRLSHGDVTCRCAFVGDGFEIVADRGDLHVELTEESPLRVEVIASHGRVESTLPLVRVGRPGPAGAFSQRYVASLGGTNPTATLRLFSGHGDVWIGHPGEAAQRPDSAEPAQRYDFSESATARAWADTFREFAPEGVARDMSALGERIGRQVEESVEQAMRRLEREMGRLEREMSRLEEQAEEDDEREEAVAEEAERRVEEEEERREEEEERREEEEERRAEQEEEREDVVADARPPAAPAPPPPSPRPPAAAPSSEMAVLEAVSRGEISVDEAMVLLSRLEAERRNR
jgi:DUF4097 and DUF4098 domain-containing protein YvlB